MGKVRRNTITRRDAIGVAVVAVLSGVVAALAGCRPTGATVSDAAICVAVGLAVTWFAASAPWWALLTAATLALAGSIGGPLVVTGAAVVAVAVAGWIGSTRANQPVVRAAVGGASLQVVLRLEFDPFFFASGLVAVVVIVLLGVTGAQRRQRYVRRRILWSSIGIAALVLVASIGFAVAGLQHRDEFTSGYRAMLAGLDHVESGNVDDARWSLLDAAADLAAASDGFGGLLTQPARMVPGLAHNRNAAVDVLERAADAAATAADALAVVDLDQLRLVDGVIDVGALAALEGPFDQLDTAVHDLRSALVAADSPWLVPPVRDRLDTGRERAEHLAPQSTALATAARHAPAMLGADGPRRYFVAFVNPAEARAHSGLMGNWTELTIDGGRMSVTRNGRTAELQRTLDEVDVFVNQPTDFYERLGSIGAGRPPEVPAQQNLWANITSTPDMAVVGDVMATMYEANAGHPVDGVFVIDPAGIASLLKVTGPIEVDEIDEPLTADNVEQFLVLDQYRFEEAEREDFLDAVTDATVDRVLTSALPAPQVLVRDMADAALHGHISAWAADPDEQLLFRQVGMDAVLPRVGDRGWTGDALAVLSDNANPNKIDSFLQRDVRYDVVVDRETGELDATLRVALTNDAPGRGFEDYVIGNAHGLDAGSNRTVLTIMSPHELVDYRWEGIEQRPSQSTEKGWNTYRLVMVLPPEGGTATIEARFRGEVEPGTYELLVRPQPLPNPDTVEIRVTERGGAEVVHHTDPIERRSILDSNGIRAWR